MDYKCTEQLIYDIMRNDNEHKLTYKEMKEIKKYMEYKNIPKYDVLYVRSNNEKEHLWCLANAQFAMLTNNVYFFLSNVSFCVSLDKQINTFCERSELSVSEAPFGALATTITFGNEFNRPIGDSIDDDAYVIANFKCY